MRIWPKSRDKADYLGPSSRHDTGCLSLLLFFDIGQTNGRIEATFQGGGLTFPNRSITGPCAIIHRWHFRFI